jgi:hypothetical protein
MSSGCIDYLFWKVNVNRGCGPMNTSLVLNERSVENLTNILLRTNLKLVQQASGTQTITIVNGPGGVIDCGQGGLNLTQTINGAFFANTQLTDQNINDLRSAIETTFNNAVDQTNKEVVGFLSNEPSANNFSSITNVIRNKVIRNLSRDTILNIAQTYAFKQQITVTNYGIISGASCIFDQSIVIRMYASALLNTINNIALQDNDVATATNKVVQYLDTKSEGLGSLFWPLVIGGIVVVVVIVIGVIVYYVLTKKK